MKKVGLTLATVIVALGITLAMSEWLVRAIVPETMFWPVSNIYQRSENPDMGYTFRPGHTGQNFGSFVSINALGFRGPAWSPDKPADTYRIVLLGDSVTFGYGVELQETFGEVLGRALHEATDRKIEVINLGVNGYNSWQELAALKSVGLALQPDLVIMTVVGNDTETAKTADDEGWLHTRPDRPSRILDRSENLVEPVSWLGVNSRLYQFTKLMWRRARFSLNREEPVALATDELWSKPFRGPGRLYPELADPIHAPIMQAITATRATGAQFVLASGATPWSYRNTLAHIAHQTQVPYIEILRLLPGVSSAEDYKQKYTLIWDSHPNPLAHGLFGLGISRLILEEVDGL